jgi:hypothetical protein
MTTSTKWFIGSFITIILSGFACEIIPNWKTQIFYFIAGPAITMLGISTFVIVNNSINKGNHDRRK